VIQAGTKWHPGVKTGLDVRIEKILQRQGFQSLAEAVSKLPDPPCVNCRHQERCAKQVIACNDFGRYVGPSWTKKGRDPSRAIYERIMKG
jgi:hypothetical protein